MIARGRVALAACASPNTNAADGHGASWSTASNTIGVLAVGYTLLDAWIAEADGGPSLA
jgi:hypothetical protein